jgi:D-3-phosphoglycerate dehydrogenase
VVAGVRGLGARALVTEPGEARCDLSDPGTELVELDALLKGSDAVSLHLPHTAETHHLLDEANLARMRPGGYLVNTARGGLVNNDALLAALDAGQLSGAGLDVVEGEPPGPDHPLLTHPRTIVTPHVAWYSEEAYVALKTSAAEEALRALRGEPPMSPVNRPSRPSR